jgi:hypothetical protein
MSQTDVQIKIDGRPLARAVRSASRAVEDMGSILQWGSPSAETWRMRCEFSRQRAAAKHRQPPALRYRLLNGVALGIIAAFIILIVWAVIVVMA